MIHEKTPLFNLMLNGKEPKNRTVFKKQLIYHFIKRNTEIHINEIESILACYAMIIFLHSENLLESYIYERNKKMKNDIPFDANKYNISLVINRFIDTDTRGLSFGWELTKEGDKTWRLFNSNLEKFIKRNRNKILAEAKKLYKEIKFHEEIVSLTDIPF